MVLDASVTIARYHHDELTLPVLQIFDQVEVYGAIAPLHWKVEIANVLQRTCGAAGMTHRIAIICCPISKPLM